MSTSFRARTVATLAALLTVVAALLVAPGARANASFVFSRFLGANRYDTAAKIALKDSTSSPTVILATGETFPDALAGNYLAGSTVTPTVPILLTAKDSLPSETDAALKSLNTKSITILGGTNAVSAAVESSLKTKGYTTSRILGKDRYDTALAVAEKPGLGSAGTVLGKKTAFLASGSNFPDALAAGPLSFRNHLPTLLTTPSALSPQAKQAIQDLKITQVVILGGTQAVSTTVEQLVVKIGGVATQRLQGIDRTQTAAAIATYAVDKLAFPKVHVNLSRGDAFPDALSGGPHGGAEGGPILLALNPTTLDGATNANKSFLNAHKSTLTSGDIFGGKNAISDGVATQAAIDAGANPPLAPAGQSTPTVDSVDTTAHSFVSTSGFLYKYDDNDVYEYETLTRTITKGLFEGALNQDDALSVIYSPGATSTFKIVHDVVHQPSKPGVSVQAELAHHLRNDVVLGVLFPSNNSSGTSYKLQREGPSICGSGSYPPLGSPPTGTLLLGVPNSWLKIKLFGTPAPGSSTTTTDVDPGFKLPGGSIKQLQQCFRYRVVATGPIGPVVVKGTDTGDVNVLKTTSSAGSTAPTIKSITVSDSGDHKIGSGDLHLFVFSLIMLKVLKSSYTFSDASSHVGTITCGSNATCTALVQPDPSSGVPVSRLHVAISGNTGVNYPATITGVSGMHDSSGNNVDLSMSALFLLP
jgi:putative cell wall-binding protein